MAEKTVSFNTHFNLYGSQLESIARWLSCNGEVWGMGPTAVFASAAALFLYNELEATVFIAGDHSQVSLLEKTLVSTMVLGMLALMIHLWVCSMRFFQYYLDTLIKDSPNILLEMTTASLLGKNELVALGPLTRFLKLQQPQIHITVCWLLALCYADYVRKHYCQRFNMPYLEQWQAELHERASRGVNSTMAHVNSFVGAVHQRLRAFRQEPLTNDTHTVACSMHASSVEVRRTTSHVSHESARASLGVKRSQQVCAHLVAHSSDTTAAAAIEELRAFVALFEHTKCGDSSLSAIPTIMWTIGSAAVAHRLISALFRRSLFRRVPLWELTLQHLLFVWMVMYSIQFWVVIVHLVKFLVKYCYEIENSVPTMEGMESEKYIQQWIIWICAVLPLALYIRMRPKPVPPPLMIWITTSPWQRREMGAYGYYLTRPPSLHVPADSAQERALALRKACSDSSRPLDRESLNLKNRRNSKSV